MLGKNSGRNRISEQDLGPICSGPKFDLRIGFRNRIWGPPVLGQNSGRNRISEQDLGPTCAGPKFWSEQDFGIGFGLQLAPKSYSLRFRFRIWVLGFRFQDLGRGFGAHLCWAKILVGIRFRNRISEQDLGPNWRLNPILQDFALGFGFQDLGFRISEQDLAPTCAGPKFWSEQDLRIGFRNRIWAPIGAYILFFRISLQDLGFRIQVLGFWNRIWGLPVLGQNFGRNRIQEQDLGPNWCLNPILQDFVEFQDLGYRISEQDLGPTCAGPKFWSEQDLGIGFRNRIWAPIGA